MAWSRVGAILLNLLLLVGDVWEAFTTKMHNIPIKEIRQYNDMMRQYNKGGLELNGAAWLIGRLVVANGREPRKAAESSLDGRFGTC